MPTLYEMPPTRSQRAKWMLEELGIDYESSIVNLRAGEQKGPEYTAINPMQVTPTWETSDYKIHESVAVVLQLADENPEAGLAPAIGTAERARYYQWCVFGSTELDFPISLVTQHELLLPEDKRKKELADLGRAMFAKRSEVLSDAIGKGPYILGETFSAADIVIGYNCVWSSMTGLLEQQPNLVSYLGRLQERPAFQRAFAQPASA